MYTYYDPDEWDTVTTSRPCTACGGDLSKCNGACNGFFCLTQRRREPEEIKKIKADKRRQHEDRILAEANEIRRRYRLNLTGD